MTTTITAKTILEENGYVKDTATSTVTAQDVLKENNYVSDNTAVSLSAAGLLAQNNYVTGGSDVTVSAQNILDANGYTTTQISLVNLEAIIDNAINYVNSVCNTTIAAMSGSAGSKTYEAPPQEATAINAIVVLMVKAYLNRGPNANVGGLSVTQIVNDPQYTLYSDMAKALLAKLATLSTVNVEALLQDTINYVNLQTNLCIPAMQGVAGSLSVTVPRLQAQLVSQLSGLVLRITLNRGSTAGLNAATVVNDPANQVQVDMWKSSLARLQTLDAANVEGIIDGAVGYVNAATGASLSLLSGVTTHKSAVYLTSQAALIKTIAGLVLRVQLSRGVSTLNISNVVNDPEYTTVGELVKSSLLTMRTTSAVNVEGIIGSAINYVNLRAKTTITAMSGSPGALSVSMKEDESVPVKIFVGMYLRAAVTGEKIDTNVMGLLDTAINDLRTSPTAVVVSTYLAPPIVVSQDPVSTY